MSYKKYFKTNFFSEKKLFIYRIANKYYVKSVKIFFLILLTSNFIIATVNQFKTNISYTQDFYNKAKSNQEFSTSKFNNFIAQLYSLNSIIPLKDPNNLRVMTYNVHFFNDILNNDTHQRIFSLITLNNPDILILEEALKNHQIIQQLKKVGYQYQIFGSIDNNSNFGNMILSKYPFVYSDSKNFSNNFKINNERYRSYIKVEIDLSSFGKKNLVIYGTHLAIYTRTPYHSVNPEDIDSDQKIRKEEIDEILLRINIEDKNKNVIIAADFNESRGKPTLNTLENAQFTTCLARIPVSVFTVSKAGTAVDHIYTRFTDLTTSGCFIYYDNASDHLPVMIDIPLNDLPLQKFKQIIHRIKVLENISKQQTKTQQQQIRKRRLIKQLQWNLAKQNNKGQTFLMKRPNFIFILNRLPSNVAHGIVRKKDNQDKTILTHLIESKYNLDLNKYRILINSGLRPRKRDIKLFKRKAKKGSRFNQIIAILNKSKINNL